MVLRKGLHQIFYPLFGTPWGNSIFFQHTPFLFFLWVPTGYQLDITERKKKKKKIEAGLLCSVKLLEQVFLLPCVGGPYSSKAPTAEGFYPYIKMAWDL